MPVTLETTLLCGDVCRRSEACDGGAMCGQLNRHGVSYSSRPKAFIRVEAGRFIAGALGLETAGTRYGRCNALFTHQERVLAEIVEILPL